MFVSSTCDTHVNTAESIGEAIEDHGVDHTTVAHFHTVPQVNRVRSLTHALLSPSHDNFTFSRLDGQIAICDGSVTRSSLGQIK